VQGPVFKPPKTKRSFTNKIHLSYEIRTQTLPNNATPEIPQGVKITTTHYLNVGNFMGKLKTQCTPMKD
jgi:hypothetical protein